MARYASVEPLSQRFRRKRGAYDGLWFAVSGGRLGVDVRQFGQFARLGGRRRRCASMARNWIDLFGPVVGFTGLGGGEKPPPIEYREHGKLVLPPNTELPPPSASAAADPAWPVNQEILRKKALKDEAKEINRRSGRCTSALYARVSGERTRNHPCGGSRRTNGKVPGQLRNELIRC